MITDQELRERAHVARLLLDDEMIRRWFERGELLLLETVVHAKTDMERVSAVEQIKARRALKAELQTAVQAGTAADQRLSRREKSP